MVKYLGILLLLVLFACKKQDLDFEIGNKYVDVRTNVKFVDSMTVKSFTVKIDSFSTSGLDSTRVVVGKYRDPEIGDVLASSYFRIGLPGSRVLPVSAVYDSILLLMVDNNQYLGDTLSPFTIKVHRLTEALKAREDGQLYNTSRFGYDPEVFGSVTYLPRPARDDTVKIKLEDSFGQELFGLIREKDDRITNIDNFLTYFKGLYITHDASDEMIMAFRISGTFPAIQLYYHYSDVTVQHKILDFPIVFYTNLQFNNFSIENPVVNFPVKQNDKLSALLTGNKTYVQGGTGLVTRFEIPYLRNLLELYQNLQILKAELVLEPARNTYKYIHLPERISLYSTDRINRFVSAVRDEITGSILTGVLVKDDLYQEETSYTFDVTSFISKEIADASDDIPALLLTIKPEELYNFPYRLVLGSQSNRDNTVKLRIYYMTYE